jgi:hypothetical protein
MNRKGVLRTENLHESSKKSSGVADPDDHPERDSNDPPGPDSSDPPGPDSNDPPGPDSDDHPRQENPLEVVEREVVRLVAEGREFSNKEELKEELQQTVKQTGETEGAAIDQAALDGIDASGWAGYGLRLHVFLYKLDYT